MHDFHVEKEQLLAKKKLVIKVNYISSVIALIFGLICYFFLDITQAIPFILIGYGILNIGNTLVLSKHHNLILTYYFSTIMAWISAFSITWYSGGINSPFIFMLALVVFTGYVNSYENGKIYLYFTFLSILLLYFLGITDWAQTENLVPMASRNIFSLLSVCFALFLLGSVYGKDLMKTHNALYKSKTALTSQMQEKETLLKEVHHRVKNNLQTVSSLLSLQARNVREAKIKELLKGTQNRVISMAMVHEMLYMRKDISKIEYKSYVQELSEYLIRSIKGLESKIKLNIDIPNVKLGIDTAIPLGLLINEVVTNSLKYGFKDNQDGEIYIGLKRESDKQYVLRIGDNGVGFSDSISHKNSESLGLKLIYNLTRQLKGTIKKDASKKGTNYIIEFQEIKQQLSPVA